ncbi:SDR family NAD(P)-dependent oxidoreductase [Hypericibacter sp.]|uniref:SDR family NAD(P)-dependent oxidoreductase n=1 Tax=Hypericibacter sp. TaxID=2705401 RepID=UPI003D6D056D
MAYRTALITGASSGIGEAIARALPPSTNLLLTGRDRPRLQALADALASNGRSVEFETADIGTDEGLNRLVAWAEPYEPDLLVNNAGFGRFGKALAEAPPEESDEAIVKVNILAPVTLTRALAPGMVKRARQNGHRAGLIYVASTVAFFPVPYLATYAASKHFLRAYVEAIANELRHDPVDLVAVCPGVTRTAWLERAHMPVPRFAKVDEPEAVARVALASIGKRPVQMVGSQGHIAACLARFLPRRFIVAAMGLMAESWG